MGDITYPVFFPFSGTDTATGSQLASLFYDMTAPSASLSVLNGHITGANFASSFDLEDIHCQRGAALDVFTTSANANLDYRAQVFGGLLFDQVAGEQYQIPLLAGQKKTMIPGANVTHLYHWATAAVCVMWDVYWNAHTPNNTAAPDTSPLSKVYFHIDGTIQQPDSRNVSATFDPVAPAVGSVDNYRTNEGYKKSRTYHGHFVSPDSSSVSGGWHTVGLGVAADKTVLMTRIHARDIVVIAFKSLS